MVTAIGSEGMMAGFDLKLIKEVAQSVTIPVIAHGGAKTLIDLGLAMHEGLASAAAAGSMFVFQGPHKAVLISYPTPGEIAAL